MSENSNEKFEPHSDEDLATILEAQLLAMRGATARSVVTPPAAHAVEPPTQPVWVDERFDVPTQEMTATEIAAVRPDSLAEAVAELVAELVAEPVAEPVSELLPAPIPALVTAESQPPRALSPMPMMFGAAEMASLMNPTLATDEPVAPPVVEAEIVTVVESVVETVAAIVDETVEEDVAPESAVEPVAQDPAVGADGEAVVEAVGEAVVEAVPVAKPPQDSPRRAASTTGNQLPDLPVFVRKSFDDLISGS
jgi:hypothetical protein